MSKKINNVPTNIISGFLGVGKTTAILSLFKKKPVTQKWAVLVNEFGKVGIDGRIYQSNNIAVKEIPGGCMCCAQGLPLQVAINRLLKDVRPDRLIIESSGVGHPAGVLKTLNGDGFKNVLTLKAGICLLDPENLINPVYQKNDLFNQQIQCADVLIANKTELASVEALAYFETIGDQLNPKKALLSQTINAELDVEWLDYDHQAYAQQNYAYPNNRQHPGFKLDSPAKIQHWQTHSFRYEKTILFDVQALKQRLGAMKIMRLKGLIRTLDGFCLLNYSAGKITLSVIEEQAESYIEVIDEVLDISAIESVLLACVMKRS